MQNAKLSDFIFVKNLIPLETCQAVINQTKDLEWNTHTWYNQTENKSVSHSEKELEVLYPEHNISHLLMEYVLTGFKEFRTMCQPLSPSTDFSKIVSQCCGIRLNRYNVNTLMRQHFDHIHSLFDGAQKGVPVLSAIGVLNDDYEGGKLTFFNDYEVNVSTGDIVIFPSSFLYPHKVTEVLSGTRYSLVSWGW
jgi:hypothetical protein